LLAGLFNVELVKEFLTAVDIVQTPFVSFGNSGERTNVFGIDFDRRSQFPNGRVLALEGFVVILLTNRHLLLACGRFFLGASRLFKDLLDAVKPVVSIAVRHRTDLSLPKRLPKEQKARRLLAGLFSLLTPEFFR
jgi:hypothetical protein